LDCISVKEIYFFGSIELSHPKKKKNIFCTKQQHFTANSAAAHRIFMTLEVNKIRTAMEAVEEMAVLLR